MTTNYSELIEEIQNLTPEEKKEVKSLIERYIIEDERERIFADYQESLKELREGKLRFSGDMGELRGMLEND